ncbi:4Fe-4S dicluster domain-containing protein [bacterium]|nr:4Fe-4S dicluster domain-containing protein [bacterium]
MKKAVVYCLILLLVFLFFPLDFIRRKRKIVLPIARVDERDTMFARLARKKGSPEYQHYYTEHPELQKTDDRLRAMTPLCEPGSRYFEPEYAKLTNEYFSEIENITPDTTLVTSLVNRIKNSTNPEKTISLITIELGAVAVGFTQVPNSIYYTHKGRFDEGYGAPVKTDLKYAIVFLVEMDFKRMQQSPSAPTLYESARQYYRAAVIAKTMSAVLVEMGYSANPQYDAHYEVILTPLAVLAGLGELGRNNILVADNYGSRVRIGAVLTEFPLKTSPKANLGVEHFCEICKKCALNCPSNALSDTEKVVIRGVQKYPTNTERCMAYWRYAGTDCGICMAVCPYSHKNNLFHNAIRSVIKLNPWIHYLVKYADDLVYGKKWKFF